MEREMIRERVQAGVRRAQAAGKHCGRPVVEIDIRPALAMLEKGHGLKTTAKALGVARSILRRRLREAGEWPRLRGVSKPLVGQPRAARLGPAGAHVRPPHLTRYPHGLLIATSPGEVILESSVLCPASPRSAHGLPARRD